MFCVSIDSYKQEWKIGRTRNAVGTRADRRVFPQIFRVVENTNLNHRFSAWIFFGLSSLNDRQLLDIVSVYVLFTANRIRVIIYLSL